MKKRRKILQQEFEEKVELVALLKFDYKRSGIKMLSEIDRLVAGRGIFGTAKCPVCGNSKVHVANPNGKDGAPVDDYFVNHRVDGRPICRVGGTLCNGSIKRLFELSKVSNHV